MKEKEHGLFTYYVLKGLGGDADDNQDKKLTIGELGKYVQAKVKEQAAIEGREQIPELQGDTEKVLVQCKGGLLMKLDANKKILIVVALVLYLLYKMMGG